MDAFSNAKGMLTSSLQKFPQMAIKSVEKIDIFGLRI